MDITTEREAEAGKWSEIGIRLALFKTSISRLKQAKTRQRDEQVSMVLDAAADLLTDIVFFTHHYIIKASELEQKMMTVELKKLSRETHSRSEH